jgi:hypothetical protein
MSHPGARTGTGATNHAEERLRVNYMRICDRKRYLLPAADVTLLPLANTPPHALAGYLLDQVLPQLQRTGR